MEKLEQVINCSGGVYVELYLLIQIDVHLIFTKLILKLFPYSLENDKFHATFVPSTIYDMNLPFNIQMKRIMANLLAVRKKSFGLKGIDPFKKKQQHDH